MDSGVHTTKEKALSLNLNEHIYGSLAEIGAGQEVAGNFFKAGGASGTIAKTMSAYDMKFSDAIYGETKRYVCEEKLMKMLDKEYGLLSKRLTHRAGQTCFFAYAITVETLNFKKTNSGHGWIGLRFQLDPLKPPNDCIIHVILKDPDTVWQQEVLGKVGVNLIYGCFYHRDPEELMISIMDNFDKGRVEIDMFRLHGHDFDHVDNRLMSLKMVKHGLTNAAMFDPKGNVMQPSSFLYKKNICVLRGRFRPVTHVNVDMMISGMKQFRKDREVIKEDLNVIAELTLKDLHHHEGDINESDFLDRVDSLCCLGQNVLISNYTEHYKLAAYLAQYTNGRRIGFIIGMNNLTSIFDEAFYANLGGGILESFGRLFGSNVKLLVYPSLGQNGTKLNSTQNFAPAPHLVHLYRHLLENNYIEDIENAKSENLHIISDQVLEMIHTGEPGWEAMVPFKVIQLIKEQKMFNYSEV